MTDVDPHFEPIDREARELIAALMARVEPLESSRRTFGGRIGRLEATVDQLQRAVPSNEIDPPPPRWVAANNALTEALVDIGNHPDAPPAIVGIAQGGLAAARAL